MFVSQNALSCLSSILVCIFTCSEHKICLWCLLAPVVQDIVDPLFFSPVLALTLKEALMSA